MPKLSDQKEKRARNVHQKRHSSWYAFVKYLIQQPRRSWVWSVRPAGTEDARFRGDPQGTSNSRWARDLVALNAMPEFHENALSLKTLQGMAGLLHDVLNRIAAAKPEPPIAPVRAAGVEEEAYLALCVSTTKDLHAPRGFYALDYLITGGAKLELVHRNQRACGVGVGKLGHTAIPTAPSVRCGCCSERGAPKTTTQE